jgi:hypothetical protein
MTSDRMFILAGRPLVFQIRKVYYVFMKASKKNVVRKRPGRPATGQDPVTAIRLSEEMRAVVDDWAVRQADRPARSEAIRRLVEIGLAARAKALPSRRLRNAHADRAKELASKTIEKVIDPVTPPEERDQRRRRLTKGPSEFREDRIDQPKLKGK